MAKTEYEHNKISIYNYREKNKEFCNQISNNYYHRKRCFINYLKEFINCHMLY